MKRKHSSFGSHSPVKRVKVGKAQETNFSPIKAEPPASPPAGIPYPLSPREESTQRHEASSQIGETQLPEEGSKECAAHTPPRTKGEDQWATLMDAIRNSVTSTSSASFLAMSPLPDLVKELQEDHMSSTWRDIRKYRYHNEEQEMALLTKYYHRFELSPFLIYALGMVTGRPWKHLLQMWHQLHAQVCSVSLFFFGAKNRSVLSSVLLEDEHGD